MWWSDHPGAQAAGASRARIGRTRWLSMAVLMIYLIVAMLSALNLIGQDWQMAASEGLIPPGSDHWLGTNQTGQDILDRTLKAAAHAVWMGLLVSLSATSIGFLLGGLGGSRLNGWTDRTVLLGMDLIDSIPFYLLVILAAAAFGEWHLAAPLAMVIAIWTTPARLARAEVHRLGGASYMAAARGLGIRPLRLLIVHLLPNLRHLFITQSLIVMIVTIKTDVVLGFLGIGDPTRVTFGSMIAESANDLYSGHWGNLVGGGLGLLLLALSLNHLMITHRGQFD